MRFCHTLLILSVLLSCQAQRDARQKNIIEENFNSGYQQHWQAENHTFQNNLAHFSEQNISTKHNQLVLMLNHQKLHGKHYTAAELRSQKMFLYGRFEAQLKASDAFGCITAFFLYRPNSTWNTEIDFEISGKYPSVVTTNHWIDRRSHEKDITLAFNSTKEFHTYVIEWKPKSIVWEIDGEVVHSTTTAVPDKAMQVVFNLWATKSENWAGSIKDAKLPTFAYVNSFKYTPLSKIK